MPSPEEARRLLCELGDHVRGLVVGARGMDMAAIAGRTSADTIYAIDKIADDALVGWFEAHWSDVELVSEGLDTPVVISDDPKWTVIVEGRELPARPIVLTAAGVAPNDPTNSHMAIAKLKALGFDTRYEGKSV